MSTDNYALMENVQRSLNRIEDKLDTRIEKMDEKIDRIDRRLSVQERFRVQVLLVGSFVVFFATITKDYVFSQIFGRH